MSDGIREGGFETFVRNQYAPLSRALVLLTGDPAEAQDLAHVPATARKSDCIATIGH